MPYLVSKDGQQFGPFELDELSRYVQEGSILFTDHCWHEGWDQWFPIHSVVSVPVPLPVSRPAVAASPRTRSVKIDEETPRFPRKKLLVTGGIVVAILISCYFASPYWTLYRLKRAVDQNDAIFVADHVDFPRFRESLKGALTASLAKEAAKEDAEGFEALGAAFGALMLGPMIDSLVTPEGLIQMMQGRDIGSIADAGESSPRIGTGEEVAESQEGRGESETGMEISRMRYETLNRFAVTIAGSTDPDTLHERSITMLFSRQGLVGWQLSAVRMALD
jgi:hypothetical protein